MKARLASGLRQGFFFTGNCVLARESPRATGTVSTGAVIGGGSVALVWIRTASATLRVVLKTSMAAWPSPRSLRICASVAPVAM